MTNVSRPKPNDKNYSKAYQQLITIVARLDASSSNAFISGLLTESEQVMLVKRLASIFLFEKGYTPYAAATKTGTSLSTAQRIHAQYLEGHFSGVTSCVPSRQKNELLELLKDFTLAAGSSRARSRLLKRAGGK